MIRKNGTPMPVDEYASTMALGENRLIENVEMGIAKDKWRNHLAQCDRRAHTAGGLWCRASRYGDITERKRAEEALRRAEENFRRSLDESPLGVRIVTEEGETLYANQSHAEYLWLRQH